MNLYEILNNIYQLQLYSETEWKEYINYFEATDRNSFFDQSTLEPSENELRSRILRGTGARSVYVDDLISPKIVSLKSMSNKRQENQTTLGVVSGAFDLLHLGHLKGIQYAKDHLLRKGDGKLCALILSDHYIRLKKGSSRPVLNINERLTMLAAVHYVDYVILLEDTDCIEALIKLKVNFYFKSPKDFEQEIVIKEVEAVKSLGGNIIFFPKSCEMISTTMIIDSTHLG